LAGAHRGYLYQDVFVACVFADGLIYSYDYIEVDKKRFKGDLFDDLGLSSQGTRRRIQIKSHSKKERHLELADLTTKRINTRIDKLLLCYLRDQDPVEEYRLVTTYNKPLDPKFLDYIKEIPNCEPSISGTTTYCYRLRPNEIWPENNQPVWEILSKAKCKRDDFFSFCNRFMIETCCPVMSADLRNPGQIEAILFDKLVHGIGVGVWPNERKDLADAAASLIIKAYTARINYKKIDRKTIINALGLRTDYGRITQIFPIYESQCVKRENVHKNIQGLINEKNKVVVVGEPGAGKSWILSEIAKWARSEGYLVAIHYCYIDLNDEYMELRSKIETMFGNLLAELMDAAPELIDKHFPKFAAGPKELERLIHSAAKEYPGRRILLIVDGIDHISRISQSGVGHSIESSDISAELEMLTLPKEAVLLVGSQPGKHLDVLLNGSDPCQLPPWTSYDVYELTKKMKALQVVDETGTSEDRDKLIEIITNKSSGNPLYATYICREILNFKSRLDLNIYPSTDSSQGLLTQTLYPEAFDLGKMIELLPPYDNNLNGYYSWILDGLYATTHTVWLAELLAILTFAIDRSEIRDIKPSDAHWVDKGIDQLRPVLKEIQGQGGVRIYHESFQRFILERMQAQEAHIPSVLAPVISWIENLGFYNDDRTFRCLLPLLEKAGRDNEIFEYVKPNYIAEAIAGGYSKDAVLSNLCVTARVASRNKNWEMLLRLIELANSLWFSYEQKLVDSLAKQYGEVFALVNGQECLAKRLLYDGKPTFEPRVGLLLCSLCDEHGIPAPWNEYREAFKLKSKTENVAYGEESDAAVEFALLRGRFREMTSKDAVDNFLKWLTSEADNSRVHVSDAANVFVEMFGVQELSKIIHQLPIGLYKALCRIEIARFSAISGDRAAAARFVTQAIFDGAPVEYYRECIDLGASPNLISIQKDTLIKITKEVASREITLKPDLVEDWVSMVYLAARVDITLLFWVEAEISGEGWYRAWLRFAFGIAIVVVHGGEVLPLFKDLASDTDPFKGDPRACDLYSIKDIIHFVIGDALSMLSDEEWPEATKLLRKISLETSVWLQNAPSGPLTSEELIEICIAHSNTPAKLSITQLQISEHLSPEKSTTEFYEIHASLELNRAKLFLKTGDHKKAKKSWLRAARYLSAYGYRRDPAIFELLYPVSSIAKLNPKKSIEFLASTQCLVERVYNHTDGKDTSHAPSVWNDLLTKVDPKSAGLFFAKNISRFGGRIDNLTESSIPSLLKEVEGSCNPSLIACLWLTLIQNGSDVESIIKIVDLLCSFNHEFGELIWIKMISAIEGEFEKHSPDVEYLINNTAKQKKLYLPKLNIKKKDNEKRKSDFPAKRPYYFSEKIREECIFEKDATPFRIIQTLRKMPSFSERDQPYFERVANALGWRILKIAEDGKNEFAINFLRRVSNELYFYSKADLFVYLGEGFERYGYADLATTAYVLSFTKSKGGGGWNIFGGSECHSYIKKAIDLNEDLAFKTLLDEVSVRISIGGGMGMTQNLIRLFCGLERADTAIEMWESANNVIAFRLPETGTRDIPEERYRVDYCNSVSLDESIVILLVARISHPCIYRKRNAATGLAILASLYPVILGKALKHSVKENLSITSLLWILQILIEYEEEPFLASKTIIEELKLLSRSDVLGFRILSRWLLERIGVKANLPPPEPLEILSITSTEKNKDVIKHYSRGRLEKASGIWEALPEQVAERFNRRIEEDSIQRRMGSMVSALRDYADQSKLAKAWYIVDEMFECEMHTCASQVRTALAKTGKIDPDAEDKLLPILLQDVDHVVRFELSRIPRPDRPIPSEQTKHSNKVIPIENGPWAGWYLIGYIETELLLGGTLDREILGEISAFGGIVFSSELLEDKIPIGYGDKNNWRIKEDIYMSKKSFLGPLTGLYLEYHGIRKDQVLSPHPILFTLDDLEQGPFLNGFNLIDKRGKLALVGRHWRYRLIGTGRLANEIPIFSGFEILLRGDLLKLLISYSDSRARFYNWVKST